MSTQGIADRLRAAVADMPHGIWTEWHPLMIEAAEALGAASAMGSAKEHDIRWAVNVLLETIAAKFEANETFDIWRSDAAAKVRSFKHDLTTSADVANTGKGD